MRPSGVFARVLIALGVVFLVLGVLGSVVPRTPILDRQQAVIFENEKLRVVLDGIIEGLNPLFVRNGILYAMEDHYLYVSTDGGETFEQRGKLPKDDDSFLAKMKDIIARNRWVRSLRRNRSVENLAVLPTGTIIVVYDQVYRSDDGGMTFHSVFKYPDDILPPFMAGLAVSPDGDVYFGEYDADARPHEISILKGENDGRSWREAYRFPSGQIFHVHSLIYDEYRDGLLIATGDHDQESHLYFTNDDFQSLRELGGDSQDWRIVSLVPTKEALYWGSDNDRTGAGIFRWDVQKDSLKQLKFIGTPSYFSTWLKDGTVVISTAYEPRSEFTKSSSPPPTIALWASRHGQEWFEIMQYDSLAKLDPNDPTRASFALPDGDGSLDALIVTAHYTVNNDFALHRLELEWKE
ncbi:MAG: hypothetical protein MRJ96_10795 [Nitrospirales bacterium]|nr:hypothetical protein [Nitrospirales bacterium]